jgi:hypothetical protein
MFGASKQLLRTFQSKAHITVWAAKAALESIKLIARKDAMTIEPRVY